MEQATTNTFYFWQYSYKNNFTTELTKRNEILEDFYKDVGVAHMGSFQAKNISEATIHLIDTYYVGLAWWVEKYHRFFDIMSAKGKDEIELGIYYTPAYDGPGGSSVVEDQYNQLKMMFRFCDSKQITIESNQDSAPFHPAMPVAPFGRYDWEMANITSFKITAHINDKKATQALEKGRHELMKYLFAQPIQNVDLFEFILNINDGYDEENVPTLFQDIPQVAEMFMKRKIT